MNEKSICVLSFSSCYVSSFLFGIFENYQTVRQKLNKKYPENFILILVLLFQKPSKLTEYVLYVLMVLIGCPTKPYICINKGEIIRFNKHCDKTGPEKTRIGVDQMPFMLKQKEIRVQKFYAMISVNQRGSLEAIIVACLLRSHFSSWLILIKLQLLLSRLYLTTTYHSNFFFTPSISAETKMTAYQMLPKLPDKTTLLLHVYILRCISTFFLLMNANKLSCDTDVIAIYNSATNFNNFQHA